MKKILFSILAAGGLFVFSTNSAFAQSYKTAAGLGLDFGTGQTLVGPSLKHFFNGNSAGQVDLLFGSHYTNIGAYYQYHFPIKGADGLKAYVGGGPSIGLYSGGSEFLLRPMAGLDYKISGAPIALNFDWRPTIYLGDGGGDTFTPARFGLGIRYTF